MLHVHDVFQTQELENWKFYDKPHKLFINIEGIRLKCYGPKINFTLTIPSLRYKHIHSYMKFIFKYYFSIRGIENNLKKISFSPNFSYLCAITDSDELVWTTFLVSM